MVKYPTDFDVMEGGNYYQVSWTPWNSLSMSEYRPFTLLF
jgi:hypothetical protein